MRRVPDRARSLASHGWAAALAAVACTLVFAAVAGANEESERLYSRGLIDLNSGSYDEAIVLFDRALAADEGDVYARYYRGVARGKTGNYAAAAADLEAVLRAAPDLTRAHLELGIVYLEQGRYADAVAHLERARGDAALKARATYFLGVAEYRQEKYDAARRHLSEAGGLDDDLAMGANYYVGLIAYRSGEREEAIEKLGAVVRSGGTTEMAQEAQRLLDELRGRRTKPWQVYGLAGFEYDTNVVLAPADQVVKGQLGLGKQNDGRAVLSVGGVYVPWESEDMQLSVGYEFYQTLQFDLTDFNLQDHRPSVQFAGTTDWFQYGFFGRYDFYMLGGDSFLSQGTMSPFLFVPEEGFGRSEIFYRAQGADFLEAPYEGVLDGWTHGPGLRQFFYLDGPERAVFIGWRFSEFLADEDAGNPYEYDANDVSVGAVLQVLDDFVAEITYSFRYEDYNRASQGRLDRVHLPIVALRWNFMPNVGVAAAWLGDFNDSNQADFDYNRQIGSITVQARY